MVEKIRIVSNEDAEYVKSKLSKMPYWGI